MLCTRVAWPHLPFLVREGGFRGGGTLEREVPLFQLSRNSVNFSCYVLTSPPVFFGTSLMLARLAVFFCLKHRKTREAFVSQKTLHMMCDLQSRVHCVKTDTVESALIGTRLRPPVWATKFFASMFRSSSDGENCLSDSVLVVGTVFLNAIKHRPPCLWVWRRFMWITYPPDM